ncbi:hypothetical protein [Lentibacillus sediminis]|uniref:hypothetical protein n=1 Tax=Lentibacillus sediminis TaxID=1940529 RepID=UPI0013041814|nr:hypothetical protein [Lentibacillus sediminis]
MEFLTDVLTAAMKAIINQLVALVFKTVRSKKSNKKTTPQRSHKGGGGSSKK